MLPRNDKWWFAETLRNRVRARLAGYSDMADKRLMDDLIAVIDDWQLRIKLEREAERKRAEIRKLSAQARS